MITPAISVLAAVEGLDVATHIFEPYIVPITLVVLIGALHDPARGTTRVGMLFGPVMVVWFITIGVLGLSWSSASRACWTRFNPLHAAALLRQNGWHGFVVLGAVFLVRHRRRGALRRHGPLRSQADPHRVVLRSSCRRSSSTTSGRAR